jgi:formylglycine-generating enzyme required for sulfatase activity
MRKYLLLHAFIISSVFFISLIVHAEKEKALTCTDSVTGMEFVLVKGGYFHMGDNLRGVDNDGVGDVDNDEMPVHEVCVDDFYIGRHEVTQGQWGEVMGSNPSNFMNGNNFPVERVSWNDVQDFIRKLNNRTGRNYRLPTEAEWEYAARSGEKKETWAGTSDKSELRRYAWYSSNNSRGQTHPVGQKEPNGLGLYDMTGNVWEWCPDWYDESYYKNSPRNNPKGASSGSRHVYRGGSWFDEPRYARASNRYGNTPGHKSSNLGFRLAMTP